jgi:predicted dehydrogenase
MTAKVSANYACVLPHFHRIDVFGSLGTFIHVPIGSIGRDESNQGQWSSASSFHSRDPMELPNAIKLPYPAVPKGTLVANFNEVISGTGTLEVNEQEALDALAVCLAIDSSIQAGQPIAVQYAQKPNSDKGVLEE